jgi:hypothetical protein
MKISQYLLERSYGNETLPERVEIHDENIVAFQKVIDALKSKCGKYYRDAKKSGKVFYRGTFKVDWREVITPITPRTDRKPKDTNRILHDMVDDLFEKKFGWRPRSQGIFTSSHRGMVAGYGNTFSVWPIGDYKFVWSDETRDMFNWMRATLKLSDGEMHNASKVMKAMQDSGNQNKIKKLIDSFQDTNLGAAWKSGNEVVFGCKQYYLVNAHHSKYVSNADMEDLTTIIEMAWEGKRITSEESGKEVKLNV